MFAHAPGRGRYDRTLSERERRAEQRECLIEAAATLFGEKPEAVSVSSIVGLARMGRNTFYDHFADLDAAKAAVCEAARVEASIAIREESAEAWTPTERLRAIARGWFRFARARPRFALALLRLSHDSAGTSCAAHYLGECLHPALSEALADAVIAVRADPVRVMSAASVMEAVTRAETNNALGASDAERVTVDMILRLFR